MITPEIFSSWIAGLEGRGMTKAAIAAEMKVSRQTVYRLANGDAKEPTYSVGKRLETLVVKNLTSVTDT